MEDNDRLMLLRKGMDANYDESWQGRRGQLWVTKGEFVEETGEKTSAADEK
jgi:hypothetical protein